MSDFHGGLLDALRGAPSGLAAYMDVEAHTDRLAIYRNNRAAALADALSRSFPALQTLLGEDYMRALSVEFARNHPPETPVLALYGAAFPVFIDNFGPLSGYPYLGDVARLDRAWTEVFFASDDPPAGHGRADAHLPAAARLVELAWPVRDLWKASRLGLEPGERGLQPRGETVLIWRGPHGTSDVTLSGAPRDAARRLFAGAPAPGDPEMLRPFAARRALTSYPEGTSPP